MKLPASNLLLDVLRSPETAIDLDPGEWTQLISLSKRHGVLGRLGASLMARGLLERIPESAAERLQGAVLRAGSSRTSIGFELNRVMRALEGLDVRIIALKGAAYMVQQLPVSQGRGSVDLDIMVPKELLEEVEQRLLATGWEHTRMVEYDEHYYRSWMHEIPPLKHPDRRTELDVHHAIVPMTSRFSPDTSALFDAAVPVRDGLYVLAPPDMVLHAAAHLFHESFETALRELFDLHQLLTDFGQQSGFWEQLVQHAQRHGLCRTLHYALRYSEHVLGTRVPTSAKGALANHAPGAVLARWMDWLFLSLFMPGPIEKSSVRERVARWALLVRSHWLKMSPLLLAYHLGTKMLRRGGIGQSARIGT